MLNKVENRNLALQVARAMCEDVSTACATSAVARLNKYFDDDIFENYFIPSLPSKRIFALTKLTFKGYRVNPGGGPVSPFITFANFKVFEFERIDVLTGSAGKFLLDVPIQTAQSNEVKKSIELANGTYIKKASTNFHLYYAGGVIPYGIAISAQSINQTGNSGHGGYNYNNPVVIQGTSYVNPNSTSTPQGTPAVTGGGLNIAGFDLPPVVLIGLAGGAVYYFFMRKRNR